MARKSSLEEFDQKVVKLKYFTSALGISRSRVYRFGLNFTFYFLVIMAVTCGGLSFAEDQFSKGTILVKGSDTYVPYSFLNEEGKIDGFNNEIFNAVVEAAGLKAKIELNTWPIIRKELETGKIDVITGMFYSRERDNLVDFSVPYSIVKYSIFTRKGSRIKSLPDLNGKEIIVMRGAISHDFLEQKGIAGKIITTKDTPTALKLLSSGKHGCALLVRLQGLYLMKKLRIGNVKIAGEPFKPMKFCFAVRKGNTTLLARLNEGLFIIKDTGKYNEIYGKWFGILERETIPFHYVLRYAAFILIPILGIFLISFIWSWSLKRQVKTKTRELEVELSERKLAEEARRESEEKYGQLFEKGSDAVLVVDAETLQFEGVNKAALDLFGYSKEELLSLTVRDTSDEPENTLNAIQKVKDDDPESKHIPLRHFIKKDGSFFFGEISSGVFVSGGRKKILSSIRDISERKRVDEALQESETRYRAVLETAADPLIVYGNTGKMLYLNPAFTSTFGWTFEELLDKKIPFVPDEYLDEARRAIKKCYSDGCYSFETRRYDKKGNILDVSLNGAIWRDPQGELQGMVVNLKDISERKKAEEALRESESKFHNLFDLSPQAIALTAVETGRFIDVNGKYCELTKYSKDELIGQTTTEILLYSKDNRGRFIKELQASDEVQGFEMDFKIKDGSIINTLIFSKTIRISSEPFILTILFDMTERKLLETQFQQAQKMEAIGTLAGGIAHDFNNLLMGIQGRASLMLMDTATTHPYYEHLQEIEDYVKSAADLTKQLLGFARGGKYEVKPTYLNELIKNQNRMFGRTKKEITIRGKYEKNLWAAEVDQGQIAQMLLNLYVNAWQSMPGGGDLYIETENITLDENYTKPFEVKTGKYVKISVTDTGVGMDKTTQQRIFDPFFTTKEMGRGTGLGLASVYGIIKNHEGFINVYSEKGEGTTFNIYLPASEKETIKEKELAKEVIKGTETVLLVDDENVIIYTVELLLKEMGYKTLIARSGKETIKIYKKNKDKIDMVILDMIMPEMGGGETYNRLKEINPDIKVLLSSGYSINGEATEILERGCNEFIQKPYRSKELSQKIRKILDKG